MGLINHSHLHLCFTIDHNVNGVPFMFIAQLKPFGNLIQVNHMCNQFLRINQTIQDKLESSIKKVAIIDISLRFR